MKNIFDLKKGDYKFYDKPQKFYQLYVNGSDVLFEERETYGVWHRTKLISGKRINIFYFQSKHNKDTRTFDWYKRVNEVCSTIQEAIIMSKHLRIETAKSRLAKAEKTVKLNKRYLENSNNFEGVCKEQEYHKGLFDITFPKLKEIRQGVS